MAEVSVNSNVMREKASILRSNAEAINGLIADMMAEVDRLRSTWEGSVAEEAIQKFKNMQAKMEERYTTINQYADFLDKAADEWDRVNAAIDADIDTVQNLDQ